MVPVAANNRKRCPALAAAALKTPTRMVLVSNGVVSVRARRAQVVGIIGASYLKLMEKARIASTETLAHVLCASRRVIRRVVDLRHLTAKAPYAAITSPKHYLLSGSGGSETRMQGCPWPS